MVTKLHQHLQMQNLKKHLGSEADYARHLAPDTTGFTISGDFQGYD